MSKAPQEKILLPAGWWDRFVEIYQGLGFRTLEDLCSDTGHPKGTEPSLAPRTLYRAKNSKDKDGQITAKVFDILLVKLDFATRTELLDALNPSPSPTVSPPSNPEEPIPATIKTLLDEAEKLSDNDRFGDAIPVLGKALKAACEAKHSVAEAKIRIRLGHALFEGKEDFAGAEAHFRKALEIAGEAPSEMRHTALHGLGDMLLWAGQLDEAGAVILASMEVAKTLGKQDMIGRSLISLGLLERNLGHSQSAEAHFDDAIRIFHQLALTLLGDDRKLNAHGLAVCYQNKAQLDHDDGRPEKALALYAKVEGFHRESGDKLNSGKIHLLAGKLHCANGNAEEGYRCFKKAATVFKALKNALWMGRVHECGARLYAQHERWEEALGPALAAVEGFKEAGRSEEQTAALLVLAKLVAKWHESGLRENVRQQVHKISQAAPKDKEAELMAHLSAQMTRVHEEIAENVRNHPDVRALLDEAKALAAKEELHKELADCLLTEMHLTTREEDKEARRKFVESAIAALEKALDATTVPKRRGHLMGELSALHRGLGQRQESASWLRRAGEVFEKAGDIFGLANFHGSMAEIHRDGGSLDDEIASYRKVLELVQGRSFHLLAAGTRINLAHALRFRRDFEEAQALLAEAEVICERHQIKDFIAAIARNRHDIETELNAGQAASHTLPQLLCSLHQLLRYRPGNNVAYLAFWYFAWKTELMALLRSGPGISLMVVTENVDRFMAFAAKFHNLANHFLMATTREPTIAAEKGVLAIPPIWRFPANFQFLFVRKTKQAIREAVAKPEDEADEGPPTVELSGPAAMLPLYIPVSVPSDVKGEGHFSALDTPRVPKEAIELMTERPIKELIQRRVVWFPSPRHCSKDPFLTDLRVAHERGIFPVYFDRLPTSDAVASVGAVQISIPASSLVPDPNKLADKWKRALLKITRLAKAEAQVALLDLPDAFSTDGAEEATSHIEVHLFEFTEIDRKVIHPVLLVP